MDPMPEAIESYNSLTKYFDTYILSTAPWHNPSAWPNKLLLVQKYMGEAAYKRLILSDNKNLNDGDYLMGDRTKNGADRFAGEHIHFGTAHFPDWHFVVSYPNNKK
jgi:5'(3')-deoxyribonucleotidase